MDDDEPDGPGEHEEEIPDDLAATLKALSRITRVTSGQIVFQGVYRVIARSLGLDPDDPGPKRGRPKPGGPGDRR